MTKLTELKIEEFAIDLLKDQGYKHIYAPRVAPNSDNPLRNSFNDVLLESQLRSAIDRINPDIDPEIGNEVLGIVKRIESLDLISSNEAFHSMMIEGVNVITRKNGEDRGDYIKLIDFDNPENNEFSVVNQFTVTCNNQTKRPDIILFINGLPFVVMELKNSANENTTIASAYNQLQTYIKTIPSLFVYNSILVISDGLEAKVGSLSSELSRFMAWKSSDGKTEGLNTIPQLDTLIKGMLNTGQLHEIFC